MGKIWSRNWAARQYRAEFWRKPPGYGDFAMADDIALGLGATVASAQSKPTKRRFLVMGMLFITVVINYLDRSNLSIASPHMSAQFHLTPTQMGLIFSAFGRIYGPLQIPGGWLVDRIHPRIF